MLPGPRAQRFAHGQLLVTEPVILKKERVGTLYLRANYQRTFYQLVDQFRFAFGGSAGRRLADHQHCLRYAAGIAVLQCDGDPQFDAILRALTTALIKKTDRTGNTKKLCEKPQALVAPYATAG